MDANNRLLPLWFNRIETGQLRLPRFQRFEAWGRSEVLGVLQAVFRGLPTGALLVLAVGDQEKFISRGIEGAPKGTERVNEHLLDGQQRLTALWKALHEKYEDQTYFVNSTLDEETGEKTLEIYNQGRWIKNGQKYPVWADNPKEIRARGLVPLRLTRPSSTGDEINNWCLEATDNDFKQSLSLAQSISEFREKAVTYNIPFLSLPVTTPKYVALDVFIKMNTSSIKLSTFDIVVAQVEEATGESLHDIIQKIRQQAPGIDRYVAPEELLLSVAALRENRPPSQVSFQKIDFIKLAQEWKSIADGIAFTVETLEEEKVFDSSRLPTVAILPVLAALASDVPNSGDKKGNARALLRAYLWRAFLTDRYVNAAATAALQDFRGLRSALKGEISRDQIKIFDETEYPLPTVETLLRAKWPKSKDILARGVMSISLRSGAYDLADGNIVTKENIMQREYHHLFPDSLITQDGKMSDETSFKALNCALITWNTNRTISAKEPIKYLKERVEKGILGEGELRSRLKSHLVPYGALNVGGYREIGDEQEKTQKVKLDFETFLKTRAERLIPVIRALCDGRINSDQNFEP